MENHHESEVEGSLSGAENEHDMSEEEDDDGSRISNNSPRPPEIKFNPAMIDPEMITKLKQGVPWATDDVDRSMGPFFFPSPHVLASQLAAAAAAVAKDKDSHRDRSPPLRFTDEAHTSNQTLGGSDSSTSSTSSQQTWSFAEQFTQLYELSDDMKRKEFLDDLFSFMQKRGTPINRLPVMAKNVLDLYELYNLVIARGGLVDVINKKLWQEIIKGLHLPSSITSAAFTLRTQYMKYLYPYECEKKRLSTPAELQAAIDGNKREGRRASYGPYPDMLHMFQISPLSLVGGRPQMNGNGHSMHSTSPNSPPNSAATPNARDALAALELSRLTLWNLYGGGATLPESKAPPQQEALNLEVPTRNSEGAQTPKVPTTSHSNNIPTSPRSTVYTPEKENGKRHDRHDHHHNNNNNNHHAAPPPPKRLAMDDPDTPPRSISIPALTGANIKINSRGDGRDSSLVVSMEINGIMYVGVLERMSSVNR
ncbi:protein dead ringer homolog isoform X2 [Folsomia candida]|uniref:protein dead ringer homolog isoform X2 n=1 Tax=Folsomia candida TaxID=158441 RepID=UPI001604F117|nr:protein dead ringer homolog isoform X2 [Folsomia candida]